MEDGRISSVARLSDENLLRRVLELAGQEREATVELVVHLAEVDTRKLYLGEGYGSLFAYCTGTLRLAEHAAYNRIEAARVSRRFPKILDLLSDGSLNLATLRLLARHLRSDNFESVTVQAKGRSKREVEVLVARLAPRPDVASSVRKLPAGGEGTKTPPSPGPSITDSPTPGASRSQTTTPASTAAAGGLLSLGQALVNGATDRSADKSSDGSPEASLRTVGAAVPEPTCRPVVTQLAPARYRVQFTIGAATHKKLRQAQDLLRREIPDGDPGAIFDRALTLLLDTIARKKLALTTNPRPGSNGGTRSRRIPAHVRRAVWLRDGGRCAFVAAGGRRCAQRAYLEFHHREPYAVGGEATVTNISLRCRAHNAYEAELVFGPGGCVVREAPALYAAASPHPGPGVSDL
jgi:hypothetical protein